MFGRGRELLRPTNAFHNRARDATCESQLVKLVFLMRVDVNMPTSNQI